MCSKKSVLGSRLGRDCTRCCDIQKCISDPKTGRWGWGSWTKAGSTQLHIHKKIRSTIHCLVLLFNFYKRFHFWHVVLIFVFGLICFSKEVFCSTAWGLPNCGRDLNLVERAPRAMRAKDDATARDDLFILVKSEMSSSELSQEPMLVWPAALLRQSQRFLRTANETDVVQTCGLDQERKNDVKRLIGAMKKDFPQMNRAIAWYQSLLDRDDMPTEDYPELTFLKNIPDEGPSVHDFRLAPRPAPLRPYQLQVVFHRQQGWMRLWGKTGSKQVFAFIQCMHANSKVKTEIIIYTCAASKTSQGIFLPFGFGVWTMAEMKADPGQSPIEQVQALFETVPWMCLYIITWKLKLTV